LQTILKKIANNRENIANNRKKTASNPEKTANNPEKNCKHLIIFESVCKNWLNVLF
jgi:hypothetical protein